MTTKLDNLDGPPLDEGDTLALRFPGPPKVLEWDDVASEYAIVRSPRAAFGLVVYAKFHGEWRVNTGAERAVAKVLLGRIKYLQKVLVEAVLPLEVIACQDAGMPYRELSPDLLAEIRRVAGLVRKEVSS